MLAGGIAALLFAMRMTAAAFDCSFSPFPYLEPPAGDAVRAALLLAAVVVLGVLIGLVLRHDRETLWLADDDGTGGDAGATDPGPPSGGVLVVAEPLERLAAGTAAGHPDVVRAEVHLSARGGALRARVGVAARPLADAAAVGAAVEAAVRDRLRAMTGREPVECRTDVRVLKVPQLKRNLP